MIDHEFRRKGIGASEVAAVLNLSPYATPFDVYISKVNPIERKSTAVQRRGKYFERGVADWVHDASGLEVEWFDKSIAHPTRSWQIASPDAWIIEHGRRTAELQIKTVNWRNIEDYGEQGTDEIPTHVIIQCQWTMSLADTPYTMVAALCGLDDLRTYRVTRDPEIEAVLLEEIGKFWVDNVLARVPPPIGVSEAATEYLKQRFPKQKTELRVATPEECQILDRLHSTGDEYDRVSRECTAVENAMKLAIGDAEGLLDGKRKVTWRRSKDSVGVAWEDVARDAIDQLAHTYVQDACPDDPSAQVTLATRYVKLLRQFTTKHTRVLKQGSRRLLTNFSKLKPEDR